MGGVKGTDGRFTTSTRPAPFGTFDEREHPRGTGGQFAEKLKVDPGELDLAAALRGLETDPFRNLTPDKEPEADFYPDTQSNYQPAVDRSNVDPAPETHPTSVTQSAAVRSVNPDRKHGLPWKERLRRLWRPAAVTGLAAAGTGTIMSATQAAAAGAFTGPTQYSTVIIKGVPHMIATSGAGSFGTAVGFGAAMIITAAGMVWWRRKTVKEFGDEGKASYRKSVRSARRGAWLAVGRNGDRMRHLASARADYLNEVDPDGRIAMFPDGWDTSNASPEWEKRRAEADSYWDKHLRRSNYSW